MSNRVGSYFDRQAVSFDSIYLNESKFARRVNEIFRGAIYDRFHIALNASGDVAGKTVLDIGCGPGHYSLEYAKRGARKVVGVDFSTRMLELARRLTEAHKVGDVCQFIDGDFLQLDLPRRFDIVLAMGVFDYIEEPVAFLRRMTAHSAGLVVASFPGKNRFRMHIRRWRYQLRNCPLFFYSETELHAIAARAGFDNYQLVAMPDSGSGFVLVGHVPVGKPVTSTELGHLAMT